MWLFLIGQLLHGAGASPLYTLGVTFIDENVSKKMSSVYLGECTLEDNIKKNILVRNFKFVLHFVVLDEIGILKLLVR
jgi:hypothetical protein